MSGKQLAIFSAAALLSAGLATTGAQAELLIYEGFADSDTTVTGNAVGTGLTGTWNQNDNAHNVVSGLSYGTLAVSGNSASYEGGARSGHSASIPGATLLDAGHLADGAVLWFSVLIDTETAFGSNSRWMLSLGTGTLQSGSQDMSGLGSGIGFIADGNKRIYATTWSGGAESKQGEFFDAVSTSGPTFVVGKITWGETTDTIDLYLPGTDLALPALPVSSGSANLTQSGFNVLAFAGKDKSQFDEIRFGTTYADVLGLAVPEPGSMALLGLGGLLVAHRRRKA